MRWRPKSARSPSIWTMSTTWAASELAVMSPKPTVEKIVGPAELAQLFICENPEAPRRPLVNIQVRLCAVFTCVAWRDCLRADFRCWRGWAVSRDCRQSRRQSGEDADAVLGGGGDVAADGVPVPGGLLGAESVGIQPAKTKITHLHTISMPAHAICEYLCLIRTRITHGKTNEKTTAASVYTARG